MTRSGGTLSALRTLLRALPRERRGQGIVTVILMLAGAVAEVAALCAVLIFLVLLTDPSKLERSEFWMIARGWLPLDVELHTWAVGTFIVIMLLSGVVRLALTWQSNSFAVNAALDLTAAAFRKVTSQPYPYYLRHGSDQIVSLMERLQSLASGVVIGGIQAMISTVIAVILIVFLLSLDYSTTLTAAIILVGTYLIISFSVRSTLSRNSRVIALQHRERVKRIQEALGGIRDIIIDRSQPVFQADFERSGILARRPIVLNTVMGVSPRIVIEVIGMIMIGALALVFSRQQGGLFGALPTLAGLALGTQRLLPLLQQSYFGWSQFFGSRESLLEVAELLSLPGENPSPVTRPLQGLDRQIAFERVGFSYGGERDVLRDVNFVIKKGERIGIVGKTGAGKSTLMDLLLGLLQPTSGQISVDGLPLDRSMLPTWQAQIAHVPQSIYLADDSLAANIAFGIPTKRIDGVLVESSARSAGIHEFIAELPNAYATRCGERGVRLSGGQRQRIGIARALYKRANVLVLDEATSALDHATEQAVIDSIADLASDITIVMVAHRVTTLGGCDRILRIDGGRVDETTMHSIGL